MIASVGGLVVTEQTVIATITAIGGVLGVMITVFGAAFLSQARKARHAAEATHHETQPNSGSSLRDQTNRIESMVQTLIFDVGGIRQENRDDRRDAATRFASLEDGQNATNRKLDDHLDWSRDYVQKHNNLEEK